VTVGDIVKWKSQSAGVWKEKTGTVVAVVLAGVPPNRALEAFGIKGRIRFPGNARDHDSYVVRAGGRLYWPRVSLLEAKS